jgi:hypothetical protein
MQILKTMNGLTSAAARILQGDWSGAGEALKEALKAGTVESIQASFEAVMNAILREADRLAGQASMKGLSGNARGGDAEDDSAGITKYMTDLQNIFNGLSSGMDDSAKSASKFTDKIKEMVSAVRSQTRAFADFTGIFDVFQRQSISGERLLNRMKAQVSAMGEWQQSISSLEQRDINKNLLEQVRAMGPQAVDQVKALSAMTDAQMSEYNKLYSQRYDIAGDQAQKVVARENQIETLIEKQEINIKVENGDARKIANDIIRELRAAGVSI